MLFIYSAQDMVPPHTIRVQKAVSLDQGRLSSYSLKTSLMKYPSVLQALHFLALIMSTFTKQSTRRIQFCYRFY
jgi:hypothetical protein